MDARAKVNDLQIEYYLHEFTFSMIIFFKFKVYEGKEKLPKVYYFTSTCVIQNGANHMLEHNKLIDDCRIHCFQLIVWSFICVGIIDEIV